MRWWVLAENLEAFVLTWRYPWGRSDIPAVLIAEQGWRSLPGVVKEKNRCCCCCMYYLNKITLKRWIMWAWSQISNLWTLRWFYLFYLDVSNQIFAELRWMMVQYVESDLDDLNMQLSDCFFFSFLRTCTDGCFPRNFMRFGCLFCFA